MMKKITSLLLVFSMTFNLFAPSVLALTYETAKQTDENTKQNSLDGLEATGNLEIDVKFTLPISNTKNPNIGLNIKDDNGNIEKIDFNDTTTTKKTTYTLGKQKGSVSIKKLNQEGNIIEDDTNEQVKYYSVTIYNLKKGSYSLELFGNGYKTYTIKDITLDDYAKRVTLSNEKGLFEIGDVDANGIVNNTDVEKIINYIDSKNEKDIEKYDLNRDGVINIADIAIVASSINGKNAEAKIVDTNVIVDPETTKIEANVEGDVTNLFKEEGTVSIKPLKETEEISKENPATLLVSNEKTYAVSKIKLNVSNTNIPEEVNVEITDKDGNVTTHEGTIKNKTVKEDKTSIIVDLNDTIEVVKAAINITKTSTKKVADVEALELINNADEIKTPEVVVPQNIKVTPSNKSSLVNYDLIEGITGYEILLQTIKDNKVIQNKTFQTTYPSYNLIDLENYTTYKVSVRSIAGEWKSAYSDAITFALKSDVLPPKVEKVVVMPVYRGFDISWEEMKDTQNYNLYYKKVGEEDFNVISNIKDNNYKLRDLKANTSYDIYVTASNDLGEGPASNIVKAKTKELIYPIIPKYNLINTSNGTGVVTNHINNVYNFNSTILSSNKYVTVDDDEATYWESKDLDYLYWYENAPIIVFDDTYKMNEIIVTVPDTYTDTYSDAKINYWNDSFKKVTTAKVTKKQNEQGKTFYVLKTDKAIEANTIQLLLNSNSNKVQIAELKFYHYDSLEDEVASLFKDENKTKLKSNVNLEYIEKLEKKANTKDTKSNEFHPNRESILNDLEQAKEILNAKQN